MATVINVKNSSQLKRAYKRISDGIERPFKSSRRMFVQLAVQIDRDTMMTFRNEGDYKGRKKWVDFGRGKGVQVYKEDGVWQNRPGTDNSKTRKYSPASKLLQASGQFKQSFRTLKVGQNKIIYGTNHKLAETIMSNPARQVLHYTKQDEKKYSKVIYKWLNKGMRF